MPTRRSSSLFTIVVVLGMGAALSACSHAEAVQQPAAQVASAEPAPPMTRERASTDCWMKYEKEGRGLSLDQRLPLVEKCTKEKLKAAAR